jgi:TatA/E family protein of Tat protein translocase
MFGIGTQEIILVLLLAVIVVGPKRLPEVATQLGKMYGEFQKAVEGLKQSAAVDIKTDLEKEDLLKQFPEWGSGAKVEEILAEGEKDAAVAEADRVYAAAAPPAEEGTPPAETPPGEAEGATPPGGSADLPNRGHRVLMPSPSPPAARRR